MVSITPVACYWDDYIQFPSAFFVFAQQNAAEDEDFDLFNMFITTAFLPTDDDLCDDLDGIVFALYLSDEFSFWFFLFPPSFCLSETAEWSLTFFPLKKKKKIAP